MGQTGPKHEAPPPAGQLCRPLGEAASVKRLGTKVKVFATALLVLCCVGCHDQPNSSVTSRSLAFRRQPPREIAESPASEEFQDISLAIVSAQQTSNATVIEASGLHNNAPVRLRIAVFSGSDGDSTVRLESTGPQSDTFLTSLGELYQTRAAAKMKSSAAFDVIPLKGTPTVIATQELKLKLFCHTQTENQYCELFLNTNIPAGTVEIAEKDAGYRLAVLSWLGQP